VFQPYGICENIPDPIARALNGLLDEVTNLRTRLAEMESKQAKPGADGDVRVGAAEPQFANGAHERERMS